MIQETTTHNTKYICDECGISKRYIYPKQKASDSAKSDGWSVTDIKQVCPECVIKAQTSSAQIRADIPKDLIKTAISFIDKKAYSQIQLHFEANALILKGIAFSQINELNIKIPKEAFNKYEAEEFDITFELHSFLKTVKNFINISNSDYISLIRDGLSFKIQSGKFNTSLEGEDTGKRSDRLISIFISDRKYSTDTVMASVEAPSNISKFINKELKDYRICVTSNSESVIFESFDKKGSFALDLLYPLNENLTNREKRSYYSQILLQSLFRGLNDHKINLFIGDDMYLYSSFKDGLISVEHLISPLIIS